MTMGLLLAMVAFMVWAIVHTNGRIGWYEDERDAEVFIRELCGALDDDLTAALDDIALQLGERSFSAETVARAMQDGPL